MTVTIEQRRGGMRIVGSGGGGKGGGGSARTPVEQPDSLHNTAYAAVLDVVGNGEMAGPVHRDEPLRDIFLNGTPIQNVDGSLNFRNVQAEYRIGTQDQEHIAGFPAAASVTSVGREVGTTTPFTQLLTNPDLSAVRITLHWPQLMRMVDSGGNAGDRVGYRVEYAIDLAIGTGSFSEVLRTAADGKTVNGYTRTHRIELPQTSHGWTVRVRRLSPEPNDSAIQSKMMVQSYAEVIDGKFRYPMTALVGIKVDAEQFQTIPTRAYHWRGQIIRVPSNYDPANRTYAGVWDGTFKRAWSNNPAWVFYDILTNKLYGLGDRIDASMVDRYALYQIGAYCDQQVSDGQGGTEPRFTCNAYIQSAVDALRLVNDLASTFRGMTYWANGQAVAVADMPSDPVYTYSNSKVAGGVFNYTGADLSTVSTVALVSWSDPSDFYRPKVEVVQDEAGIRLFGIRKTEITAFGCSSRGQAQRVGLYHLYTSLMEQGGVSFAVGLEGVIPQPGSLVRIADANRSGRRNGGLISAATARVVTLDAEHSVKVGDRLTVNLPSGKSETRTVSVVAGRKVTVSTAFGEVPATESSWSVDADDLVTQLVRVISVKDVGGITFEISGVFHHPDKFNAIDSGVRLEPLPVSIVPPRVQSAPTNVRIVEHHTVRQGVSRHTAEITWDAVEHATAYDLQWRRDSGDWVQVPRTGTRLVEIPDIYSGSYIVRVRAINALDVPSLWAYSEPTELSGQVGQPPAVASLIATPINWGIRLNWGFPTGPNIFERTEIRYGSSSAFAQSVTAGGFAYPTNQFEQAGLAVTTEHFYWARLIDKNGTPGPWYPAENQPGVRGKPSQDAEGYNELVTKEIAEGALGELIMGNIHDIPNIRDTAGTALAETGLQAQKIADNAQAIAQEIIDRGNAVSAESQARIDGQAVAAQALADGLTAEASARGAAIATEKTERQAADASLAGQINTVSAAVGDNAAAIRAEELARTTADSAEANARETLAVQVRGDYSGSDVSQVSTGLIGGLKRVVADNHESVVQQMSQLQAGIGEQFDYAKMWYWEGASEGWSGSVIDGSWLRPVDRIAYVISPRGLDVNGAEYPQVRLRLKKVGNPTWNPIIGLYAPGATGGSYTMHVPPQPDWDENGIGVVVLTHTHQGVIDGIILRGTTFTTLNDENYYAFDWFAVGRPAPGASTAALNAEAKLRATADIAEATSRETLSVKLIGKADPTGVTLDNVTSGLFFDEKSARASGDEAAMTEISGMKARMPAGAGKLATEAGVLEKTQALAAADSALSQRATALESRMPTGNGKLATADAVSALDTRVEQTESKQTSTASDVTQLKTSVTTAQNAANSAQTSANAAQTSATAAQTAAQAASDKAGEKGEVIYGSTAPAAAKRLAQNLWIDTTGNANTPKRWNGSAWVVVTDKVATDAVAAAAQAKADAAVAKAAADAAQQTANQKADATAVDGLTNRVTATENGLTAAGERSTIIEARIAADQDSDSLIPDYLMANPECWFSRYGHDLTDRFVMTETGKVASTVFRHSTGGSWNYSRTAIPTGTQYRVRFWARRSTDSDGSVHITMKNVRPNGTSSDADYGGVNVTPSVPADGQWHLVDRVILPSDTTFSRVHFGFATNHTSTKGWGEAQGFRVTGVAGAADINPSEVATARSVSSLSSTVSQIDGKVTSQSEAVALLSNTINDPATGLQATADALSQTNTKLEGTEKAVIDQKNVLQAGLRQIYEGEDAELEKALAVWESHAAIAETRQIVATEVTAMAEIVDIVRVSLGGDSAAVQETLQALVELEGKMIAQWGINVQLNVAGVPYAAGLSLGIVNEGGITRSALNVVADMFNVMHDVNGQPKAVFSVQGGAAIINTALIGTASIKSAHIESLDALKIESQNLAAVLANIGTAYIDSAHMKQGSVKRLHVGVAEIDTLRVAGRAITIVGQVFSPGQSLPNQATRDTVISMTLPVASDIVISVGHTPSVYDGADPQYRPTIRNDISGATLKTLWTAYQQPLYYQMVVSAPAGLNRFALRLRGVSGIQAGFLYPESTIKLEAYMR